MIEERLIPKEKDYQVVLFYDAFKRYRCADYSRVFHAKYEYWYDGAKFLIGIFEGEKYLTLIERETFATGACYADLNKKPTAELLIKKFKEKLSNKGVSIHEVIRDFKLRNLDLELWLINTLII